MIEKYGITLEELNIETAMLVREWRNSKRVNQFMDFKEHISKEQQVKWFKEIFFSDNHFFLIKKNKNPIGLVHLDRFNSEKTTAYAGLFIGEENYEGTGAAFAASIILLDFAFNELSLHSVYAKVHAENEKALNYNIALGFKKVGKESEHFNQLKVDMEVFYEKRKILVPLLTL